MWHYASRFRFPVLPKNYASVSHQEADSTREHWSRLAQTEALVTIVAICSAN
jgi:hypothetical protein